VNTCSDSVKNGRDIRARWVLLWNENESLCVVLKHDRYTRDDIRLEDGSTWEIREEGDLNETHRTRIAEWLVRQHALQKEPGLDKFVARSARVVRADVQLHLA
jgi:hypothetical protein